MYHKFSRMNSAKFSLFFVQKRAFKIFNNEAKQDVYSTKKLLKKCFSMSKLSNIGFREISFSSLPYYGHVTFWIDYLSLNKKVSSTKHFEKSLNDYICIFCGTTIFDTIF